MGDTDIIAFHRDIPPFRAKRMNYLDLVRRIRGSRLPSVDPLPGMADIPDLAGQSELALTEFFDPDGNP